MPRVLEVNVDDLDSGGVYSLVRNFILHKSENLHVDIAAIEPFVHPENMQELENCGTAIHYVGYKGSKWKKQIVCYRNLKKLLEQEKYDYVHIHADVANKLLVSGLAAKHAGVSNIVLHSHSSGVDGNHRKMKIIIHKMFRRLLKQVGTHFVACSRVAAEWMFPNISIENITIISNGIDLEKFRFNPMIRARARKELGITDEVLLGHVGRFGYQKNHEYLIEIMKEVKKAGIRAKLLLVGEGPKFDEIKNLVRRESLEKEIIFFGSSKRVHELLQAMDIFLLPSRFEGLPIVGIEAQAAGLPVIFSDRITREAAMCLQTRFLPITESGISLWIKAIKELSKQTRRDGIRELKEKKFSIEDTVKAFEELYCGGNGICTY